MNLASARVIVMDDDPVVCNFVVSTLRRMGVVAIETAPDGTVALRVTASFRPDVVLTDIHMHPMNGLDFVQQLRQHANSLIKHMRVIFMSADASPIRWRRHCPWAPKAILSSPPGLKR